MRIFIYTDGGCSGNPGPGGWAYVMLKAPGAPSAARSGTTAPAAALELVEERYGGEILTTNNRMELLAAISALERLDPLCLAGEAVELYTDSQYLQKGMTEWLPGWKRKNWQSSGKTPVKNRDLWQRLDALSQRLTITWRWVRGHAGHQYNERCDTLTQQAIAEQRG
jgi:ribonuclease HI